MIRTTPTPKLRLIEDTRSAPASAAVVRRFRLARVHIEGRSAAAAWLTPSKRL
jgi:hypothetical protein